MQIKIRKSAKIPTIDGIEYLHYWRNDEMKNKRSRTMRRKTAKLAEIMAEKLTEHRQISDRFVQMAGKRTFGTDFAPEQVE